MFQPTGPFNHETTLLFWEMVWQSGCTKIVMLANTREQHKVSSSQPLHENKHWYFVYEMTKAN